MKKINDLLQSPFRWFLLGFILTPMFVSGAVVGNSEAFQAWFHPYGSAYQSKAQSYADQILEAGRKSRELRSLISLKAELPPVLASEGIKVAGLTDEIKISNHQVNRKKKQDALAKPSLLQQEAGLIRRFPEIPMWKGKDAKSSALQLINYSPLTNDRVYQFGNAPISEISPNVKVITALPTKRRKNWVKSEDLPIPVRKDEFLERTKHYYGSKLSYNDRKKEQHCLAIGIYFEARGEPKKGQVAVAQVIINRVKERFYPNTVCKVVWQGSHRKTGCQFSFTCDGLSDKPRSWRKWRMAKRIARKVMNGKAWLKEIGNASHYHATYVSPKWRHGMWRRKKIGLHIFYRGKFLHKKRYRKRRRAAYRRRGNTQT
ncbi:MAG: cell wall hydrolase [Methyloligellaceae bacterium]